MYLRSALKLCEEETLTGFRGCTVRVLMNHELVMNMRVEEHVKKERIRQIETQIWRREVRQVAEEDNEDPY